MERKYKLFQQLARVSAAALLCVGAAACSSDDTGQVKSNNDEPDVVADTSGEPDVGGGGEDVGSEPDTSDEPDTVGSGGDDVGPDEPDVVSDVGGEPDVGEEPDVSDDVMPDVEPVDCYYPSSDPECPQGPYGPSSFINELRVVPDQSCCHDFNGDGRNDNYLGTILGTLSALPVPGFGDVNQNIAAAIGQGQLVYLIEFADWSHPLHDDDLTVTILRGEDADFNFSDNLQGTGDFNVQALSFDEHANPRWQFEHARVRNGELLATGGTLELQFPGLLDEIKIALVDVRLKARVVDGGNRSADLSAGGRVWLEAGELAGALQRDTLFESLNNAAQGCECIQDARPLFSYNSNSNKYACNLTAADAQRCASASAECSSLAHQLSCGFFANQSGNMDVDTTRDGNRDAYSFGARFETVGARLVGTTP